MNYRPLLICHHELILRPKESMQLPCLYLNPNSFKESRYIGRNIRFLVVKFCLKIEIPSNSNLINKISFY